MSENDSLSSNPLISILKEELIPYDKIKNSHYLEAFKYSIAEAKSKISSLINSYKLESFNNISIEESFNFMKKFEEASDLFDQIKTLYNNKIRLDSLDEENLNKEKITSLITDFENWIYTNIDLFQRIDKLSLKPEIINDQKNTELKQVIKYYKRKFIENCCCSKEGGETQKNKIQELKKINEELSNLIAKYEKNLIDATNDYVIYINDESIITEFPETVKERAKKLAKEKGHENGYCFGLDYPSYSPFMMYCTDREKRKEMFLARNSKCLFEDKKFCNIQIMKKIIELRQQKAKLLGFNNYNEYVLENRMAKNEKNVEDLIKSIQNKVFPVAQKEYKELSEYANFKNDKILEKWDLSYYSEKLKQKLYNLNSEELRKFFPLEKVFEVVFELIENLYEIKIEKEPEVKLYHPDVKVFSMHDSKNQNKLLGYFYFDLFPRKEKTSGGWVYALKPKVINKLPIVGINANNRPPNNKGEVFCSLGEAETIFHELGHALHIVLSETKFKCITGINVLWDFVELPSQMNENFIYEKRILKKFSIDDETIEKILQAKNYLVGIGYLNQMNYSYVDLKIHSTEFKSDMNVEKFEKEKSIDVFPKVPNTCFTCSFSHLFNATYDYSCGYYSYIWAEVLALDAYEEFKNGKEKEAAVKFRKNILSKGGSEEPDKLFYNFKGRNFTIDAFLKDKGLV